MARKKLLTPELMADLFQRYQAEVKKKPIIVEDWVGGMGKKVKRKKERPLTMEGFELFVFKSGYNSDLSHYFSNQGEAYNAFIPICAIIKKHIRADQIEGGMAGIYNPSITQRLNGLTEKIQEDGTKEVTVKVKYERKKPAEEE
jgi:hypothetical protein